MQISFDINDVDKHKWDLNINNNNIFNKYDFLKCYQLNNPSINHVYIISDNTQFYGHIFTLKLSKTSDYSNYITLIFDLLLRVFPIKFFYCSNSFITNIPSYVSREVINLTPIIVKINSLQKPLVTIIPDFLFENKFCNINDEFVKMQVEDEMSIVIKDNWRNFNDYKDSLKTKYRKRILIIEKNSNPISINLLDKEDLINYEDKLQLLFKQVLNNSSFVGPTFQIKTFQSLISLYENINIFGYFLDNKIVAFSCEIEHNNYLYSYFVGFDYKINKSHSLYARILCESINSAILKNKKELILGRTANEFKSNFGAIAKKSSVYIKVNNYFLRLFLNIFIKRVNFKNKIYRNPFKKVD